MPSPWLINTWANVSRNSHNMINLKPIPKPQKWDAFQLNAGLDTVNNPIFLDKGKMTMAKNVVFYDTGWTRRNGMTLHGASGSSNVNAIGAIKKESGDILVRCYGTAFQKYTGWVWTTVAWPVMTDIKATIVSFLDSDMTSAASKTGTATATSTNRTLDDNAGGMTINAYAGKIILITSGTGSGQAKFITSNDLVTFYIEWLWETTPDATSVYAVRSAIPHVFVTNGTDSVFKYDGTTVTTFATMTKWNTLEVAHDRLWGARQDLDYVYYSNLGTSYFQKDQNIEANPNGDVITRIKRNHEEIIVYKRNTRHRITGYDEDQFQFSTAGETIGAIAQGSVAHGQNFNFFLGYGGIYMANSLDQSSLDEWLPISKDINDQILAHSDAELLASEGWIDDNKYYLSVGSDVYVYDIIQSQITNSHVFSIHNYADNIRSAYVDSWIAYVGSTTKLYTLGGNTDNGTTIDVEVRSGRRAQGDKDAYKIYGVGLVSFSTPWATCNVTVAYSIEWGSYTSFTAQNVASDNTIRCPVNARGKDIMYKYTYSYSGSTPPQFIMHEQFASKTTKPV